MRILLIVYNRRGKGTYWRALQLGRYLARHQQQVTLLTTATDRRWRFNCCTDTESTLTIVESPNILGGPLSAGWDPLNLAARLYWSMKKTRRGAERLNFDVVHGFECRPTVIGPALYWQASCYSTLILDWCDWFGREGAVAERSNPIVRALLRPAETFFEESFRRRAQGTTVINRFLHKRAVDLGVRSRTILCLPNGSDTRRVQVIPIQEARKRLDLSAHVPLIVYVGAAFPRDAHLMARALNCVLQLKPMARLLLVGYFQFPLEEWLEHPDAVIRTGTVSDEEINLYVAAANVGWLPLCDSGANRGRFPLKIHDYIAAGRPVIGTEVGDLGDFIRRGCFGVAVEDSPEAIGRATVDLLNDEPVQQAFGARARRFAENEANWERAGERLLDFYREVVRGQDS